MSTFYGQYPMSGGGGVSIYANLAAFPNGSIAGQLGVAADTGDLYEWNGSSWVMIASPTAAFTIGALDSQAANANGLALVGGVLSAQSADATHPGLVNNTTQSFSGNKTFTGTINSGAIVSTSTITGTQLISNIAIGTAPLVVTSTTNVPNLNASTLSGATFAAPGPIGSTIASTGAFTTLSATGQIAAEDGTVSAPGYAFTNELGTGLYRIGTTELGVAVGGVRGIDILKTAAGNVNLGFGNGANATANTNDQYPSIIDRSINAGVFFQYGNANTTSHSYSTFQIYSGSNSLFLSNYSNAGTGSGVPAYFQGQDVIQSDQYGSLILNSMWNNTGGFIGFAIGGTAIANEAMRLTSSALTLNKGAGSLVMSGGTSGTVTLNTPATPTTYAMTLPAAQGTTNYALINTDGAGTLGWAAILTNPMTTLGDMLYGGASGALTRLTGDTSNTRKFLRELSVTSTATAPVWDTLLAGDIPVNLTGLTTANALTSASTLATVGTIGTGTWQGTAVTAQYGGTGLATLSAHDVLVGNGTGNVTLVSPGTAGKIMVSNGTGSDPSFAEFNSANVVLTMPTVQTKTSAGSSGYIFVCTGSPNATINATYNDSNSHTYTVLQTANGFNYLVCSGGSVPAASGNLTKQTGSGDATIAYTSFQVAGTYTTPANVFYLKVKAIGAGGGGSGGGASGVTGNAGGAAIFVCTTTAGQMVMQAGGGAGGVNAGASQGGAGGATLISGTSGTLIAARGGNGGGGEATSLAASYYQAGGQGGSSSLGGNGGGGTGNQVGTDGGNNTGGGGGGGATTATTTEPAGQGGGAGATLQALIASPQTTYYYSCPAGGAYGGSGTNGTNGGNGGSAFVVIEEFYQ